MTNSARRASGAWYTQGLALLPTLQSAPSQEVDAFLSQHARLVEQIANRMITRLTKLLADIHRDTTKSDAYWKIILGSYVYRFCDAFLVTLLTAPDSFTQGRETSSLTIPRADHDFIDAVSHNSAFMEAVLHGRDVKPRPDVPDAMSVKLTAALIPLRSRLRPRVIEAYQSALPNPAFNHVRTLFRINVGAQVPAALALISASAFKAWPISLTSPDIDYTCERDHQRQSNFGEARTADLSQKSDDFITSLIASRIAKTIPRCWLEDYTSLTRALHNRLGLPNRVERLAVTPPWKPGGKLLVARAVDRGVHLTFVQHGGTYGQTFPSPEEMYESNTADEFATWGWKDGPKHRPMPAPRMVGRRYRSSRDRYESRYLVALSAGSGASNSSLIGWMNAQKEVLLARRVFFDSLPHNVKRDAVIRPHPRELELFDGGIAELPPSAGAIAYGGPVENWIRQVGLVVTEGWWSTLFLECIANDLPVIAYGVGKSWVRPEARAAHRELEEVGVLYADPAAAASEVAAIRLHARDWWDDPIRQAAVNAFRNLFACVEPSWWKAWGRYLSRSEAEIADLGIS